MAVRRDATAGFVHFSLTRDELRPGDTVLHEHHGFGRFLGKEMREAGGVVGEYFVLGYADGNRLFVPVGQSAALWQCPPGSVAPPLSRIDTVPRSGTSDLEPMRNRLSEGWAFWANGSPIITITDEAYESRSLLQETEPVQVCDDFRDERGRCWWWFKGHFYSSSDPSLGREEVAALVFDSHRKHEDRLSRAVRRFRQAHEPGGSREPIPDDVKIFVWRRDEGKCVRCGSNEELEFDHIIPRSKGGSDTARNLQLLCEPCNRAKGSDLV